MTDASQVTAEHVTVDESDHIGRPVHCHLCDSQDRVVYWGLATFGIDYSGETRFICNDCITKITTSAQLREG